MKEKWPAPHSSEQEAWRTGLAFIHVQFLAVIQLRYQTKFWVINFHWEITMHLLLFSSLIILMELTKDIFNKLLWSES